MLVCTLAFVSVGFAPQTGLVPFALCEPTLRESRRGDIGLFSLLHRRQCIFACIMPTMQKSYNYIVCGTVEDLLISMVLSQRIKLCHPVLTALLLFPANGQHTSAYTTQKQYK